MNLLVLSTMVPMPADDGGRVGILNMVRYLRRHGHTVHFVAPRTRANDAEAFAREATLHLIDLDPASSLLGRLRSLPSSLPYAAEKFFSRRALAQIESLAAGTRFDALHIEHLFFMRFALALKDRLRLPVVLHEHNIESEILCRFRDKAANPLIRLYAGAECRKMLRFEAGAINACDLVFPVTEDDARKLRKIAPRTTIVPLPHGVDVERLRFAPVHRPDRLLFLTNFDWLPNRDSFDFYRDTIHREIVRKIPGLHTLVVGKDLQKVDRRDLPDSIEFLGFLPDLNEAPRLAPVAIVPLRIGSGVRVKILELMALGVVVVSTTLGAEGIQATPGEHLVVADDPVAMAEAVQKLLRSPVDLSRMAAAARKFIEDHHSTTAISSIVNNAYRDLLARRSTASPEPIPESGTH